jgi:hypothetical protein
MADEEGKPDGEVKESEPFDPKSLSPEAQEFIRREVQSQSDSKAQLVETKLRADQATASRQAVETAESNELRQMAERGDHEALGQRVAARLNQQTAEGNAIARASDVIERQMSEKFSETLGAERVESIRREVIKEGGAHAEFAEALAKASGGESRAEEIRAEVKAQLMEARGEKRDEAGGGDKITPAGQGSPPSGFDEIERAYVAGTLPGGREAYAEAKEANKKGR